MVTPSWLYFISHHLLIYLQIILSAVAVRLSRSAPLQWMTKRLLPRPLRSSEPKICGLFLSRREGWFQLRLACDREQKCRRRWIKSTDAHVDVLWLHNDTTDCVSAQHSPLTAGPDQPNHPHGLNPTLDEFTFVDLTIQESWDTCWSHYSSSHGPWGCGLVCLALKREKTRRYILVISQVFWVVARCSGWC